MSENNPLLDYGFKNQEFAPYAQIKAEHIVAAIKTAIEKAKTRLEEILAVDKSSLDFNNTLYAFIEFEEIIGKIWTPVENLLSLKGEKEIRDAANEARPLVVEFYNNYSLDPRVYDLVKAYAQTDEAKNLQGEKKRHLENTLLDFKLSGAELEGDEKEEFKKLNLKLSDLTQKFSDNATDSKFEMILSKEDMDGLPEDAIEAAKLKADEFRKEAGKDKVPADSYIINLDYPSYGPFMKFSTRGDLRKKLYFSYLNKATENANGGLLEKETKDLNNKDLIKEIFSGKLAKAKLLGFKNYAELSLQTKMAPSPEEVKTFLERLADKSKALAQKEYQELVKYQKEIGYENTEADPEKIMPWDKEYLSEKLRKAKFDFDTNLTKPYFELESTVKGMFDIARKIFNIDFVKSTKIETWHDDVDVYQVTNPDGSIIGTFHMDLFPRDIKRQGAWVMPLVAACTNKDGSKTKPQCTLSCNLTKPTESQPSLLNHLEVTTLFHEFGHAIHHLLSKVELEPLSGTSVEWDFVELPSQLQENFCWERESLETFAKHYKTGEAIPNELLDKMLKARNFNEGLACTRQNEFGLFDLAVYMTEGELKDPNEIFKDIVAKYGIFDFIEGTNFPCAFSHIFAGGYSAGYYSYKWAEVLEADAFSRFQDEGVLNPQVGQEYREKILEKGDSEAPMELFKSFMGREPSEDALLKRMGLEVVAK